MGILTDSLLTDFIALIVTLIAVVYAYFKWSFQHWKRRGLPYLEPTIPFGNLPNPFTSDLSVMENTELLYREAKARGLKHCGVYFLNVPTHFFLDLDLLKHIMTKDFNHFVDRGVYKNEKDDPLSGHLFALDGQRWKNLRAKLSPTFTSGKMRMMFQTMVDCGAMLEKYFEDNFSTKGVVDIKEVLGCFTTDIIGSAAFGLECNTFQEPNSPFRVYGKKVFEAKPLVMARALVSVAFPSVARALGFRVFSKEVGDFYTKVVKDTIAYREKNNVSRNDFMQLLMEMRNKEGDNGNAGSSGGLTMEEIIAQSFVFFVAGFETSSTTMTFALFELSTHPEIQDKVREEIKRVLAKHDNKITYDAMNEMVYMKQVIDETLRMYPPLALLQRQCVEDYKVPGEDFVIEKDAMILIPAVGIHYDEDYYENPREFDPEKFSDDNKKNRHPYAHLPFGEGPRICIGERFGIMQTKVGLTSLLKNYRFSLNEKTKVPIKIDNRAGVTAAKGGIWLNVERT